MTVNVGDKVVMIPLRGGGYAAVRSGDISVGDKVIMIPGQDGRYYAIKPASPSVGDRVILYPLRGGGYVCLSSADDAGGGSSTPVLPPANFQAIRDGPSTAALKWSLNSGNDAVRIVRRSDRYPTAITDGNVVYEGAATSFVDSGLDYRSRYYYCAWGRTGSRYSNGYLMDWTEAWGSQSDPVFVCEKWSMPCGIGARMSFGPFSYSWNGVSRVYLSSAPDSVTKVCPDNGFTVSAGEGVLDTGDIYNRSDRQGEFVEITSILSPGRNSITVEIVDIWGMSYGSGSEIWIMHQS
jgi:hypothetical protein